jgi:type II secretory pathway pseudopilin PulG
MNSARRQKGFILLTVVVLMALMGTGLIVWAAQSRNMIRDTQIQVAQASLDNAIASAVQWANANRSILKKTAKEQPLRLDLTGLQTPGLECQYRVIDRNSRQMKIEITAVSRSPRCPARKTIRLTL